MSRRKRRLSKRVAQRTGDTASVHLGPPPLFSRLLDAVAEDPVFRTTRATLAFVPAIWIVVTILYCFDRLFSWFYTVQSATAAHFWTEVLPHLIMITFLLVLFPIVSLSMDPRKNASGVREVRLMLLFWVMIELFLIAVRAATR